MKSYITGVLAVAALLLAATNVSAEALTFTKLTGVTGGQIAGTGVYRADLATLSLDAITQFVITDNSQGFGGFTGQFSGFDLDAIVISATSVDTAAEAKNLVTQPALFNYFPAANPTSSGVLFTPGTQRAPTDPKLFASVLGTPVKVDPTIATFGALDGNATIFAPFVKGFASMGDGGVLTFNLAQIIDTTVTDFHLWLYIGEVGDNGEQANGAANAPTPNPASIVNLVVTANGIVSVPEPSSIALLAVGLVGLAGVAYRRRKTA